METTFIKNKAKEIPEQPSPIVYHFWERKRVQATLMKGLLQISRENLGSWPRAFRALRVLRRQYRAIIDQPLFNKIAKVDGRYFWRLTAPGPPSRAARLNFENELNRLYPFKPAGGLRTVFFAITKKCPLACEHCFEGGNLNQKETLSSEDLIQIVRKYQNYGTTQIMLSGGEPMVRIKDVFRILENAQPGTDFWMITSGFQLTADRARQLKQAGLTGVEISLDDYRREFHDRFRGYDGAYDWALRAAVNARRAGLVTALSLVATRSFATEANLRSYLELARYLGAAFVQLLEPRAAGHYEGKDVELSMAQKQLLARVYKEYNTLPIYRQYPIVNYGDYLRRRTGCQAVGNRFLYIDTDGDIHVCPFCRGKVCNALSFSAADTIRLLGQMACHASEKATF